MNAFESSWTPIAHYFSTLKNLLSRPTEFFKAERERSDLTGPLAFALLTHWIGEALAYLWRQRLTGLLSKSFADLSDLTRFAGHFQEELKHIDSEGRHQQFQQVGEQFMHWAWGVGAVLIDPLVTLLQLLFFSVFIYAGARILINPQPGVTPAISFPRILRLCAFATAPALFAMFPVMGPLFASLAGFLLLVVGVETVFQTSRTRAVWVASFPYVLLTFLVFGLFAVLMIAAFKMFAAFS